MTADARLFLGDFHDTLAGESWDLLCVDAPYGARTHSGNGEKDLARNVDGSERRPLSYSHWSAAHVEHAVKFLAPRTSGWFCTISDTELTPIWASCLAAEGRYVFAPLPIVIPGMSVRLSGDGPSSESVQMIVARPRSKRFAAWGTLPGFYLVQPGDPRRRSPRIGGKPLGLMERIVRDYSRPGDLVCDPCAGAGTTLLAALRTGRRALGSEIDPEAHAIASADLLAPHPLPLF